MALMSCPECSTQVSDRAISCPSCGCPIVTPPSISPHLTASVTVSKSRGVYIILGLVFGVLGFHNFYSGNYGAGATKLIILLLAIVDDSNSIFNNNDTTLVAVVILGAVTLYEIINVKADKTGKAMT
jgi:hypothetical protein